MIYNRIPHAGILGLSLPPLRPTQWFPSLSGSSRTCVRTFHPQSRSQTGTERVATPQYGAGAVDSRSWLVIGVAEHRQVRPGPAGVALGGQIPDQDRATVGTPLVTLIEELVVVTLAFVTPHSLVFRFHVFNVGRLRRNLKCLHVHFP